jgi:tetratricopeptide (TPR) repeat protein
LRWPLCSSEKLSELTRDGERAEALLRESLEAHATARVASRLGDLREQAGDLKQAEALYRRAMELAPAAAEAASIANSLGLVLEEQGRITEAEPWFARAASLYEKLYGRNHPDFATVLVNLAGALRARGDLNTATGMLQNARNILLSTVGSEHPNAQAACRALNEVLVQAGRSAQRGCSLSELNTPIQ